MCVCVRVLWCLVVTASLLFYSNHMLSLTLSFMHSLPSPSLPLSGYVNVFALVATKGKNKAGPTWQARIARTSVARPCVAGTADQMCRKANSGKDLKQNLNMLRVACTS